MPQLVVPNTIDTGTEVVAAEHQQNYDAIAAIINGGLDEFNLTAALAAILGVSQAGFVRAGTTGWINDVESRTNAAFGLLAHPDRVSGIVLPNNGLMFIGYQALWKESVVNTGRAAIFLGANQVKRAASSGGAPEVVEAGAFNRTTANRYAALTSFPGGLHTPTSTAAADATTAVTTGQLLGGSNASAGDEFSYGIAIVFAAAGTYDVSVQYRATSGTVTAKERKLWVWTRGF